MLPVTLLVLADYLCISKRSGKRDAARGSRLRRGIDSTGQPKRDLLDEPHVSVGIFEGDVREVALALGVRAADTSSRRERRAVVE